MSQAMRFADRGACWQAFCNLTDYLKQTFHKLQSVRYKQWALCKKKKKNTVASRQFFPIYALKCHISKTEVFERQTFTLRQENISQKISLRVAEFSDYLDGTSSK